MSFDVYGLKWGGEEIEDVTQRHPERKAIPKLGDWVSGSPRIGGSRECEIMGEVADTHKART